MNQQMPPPTREGMLVLWQPSNRPSCLDACENRMRSRRGHTRPGSRTRRRRQKEREPHGPRVLGTVRFQAWTFLAWWWPRIRGAETLGGEGKRGSFAFSTHLGLVADVVGEVREPVFPVRRCPFVVGRGSLSPRLRDWVLGRCPLLVWSRGTLMVLLIPTRKNYGACWDRGFFGRRWAVASHSANTPASWVAINVVRARTGQPWPYTECGST